MGRRPLESNAPAWRDALIRWPVALATLFFFLLVSWLLYTQRIVEAMRSNSEALSEFLAEVQAASQSPDPTAAETALFRLREMIVATGVPLVVTGPQDTVLIVENLPFDVDLSTPDGQERTRRYVRSLDLRNPPVGDPNVTHIHYGDTPEVRGLRWIPPLQVFGILLIVFVSFTVLREQRRAAQERAWTSMARELAHQLGTPISSLQGWLEVLRLTPDERPGDLGEREVADAIADDLERLERVSHRFELIGREPELEELDVRQLLAELEGYIRARLPRFGAGAKLRVEIAEATPPILGSPVLLAWALENVVKNALDAMAGRTGRIEIRARQENDLVAIRISDTGPGVDPEIRDRIFEPGITTKSGGWGVGLALSRRIVEGVHGGRIQLLDGRPEGATFVIRLPAKV